MTKSQYFTETVALNLYNPGKRLAVQYWYLCLHGTGGLNKWPKYTYLVSAISNLLND
jgi:hypothetical protein